jgi:Mor family transcriptional regulator
MPREKTLTSNPSNESAYKEVIPVSILIEMLGEAKTIELCRHYQGHVLPSILSLLRLKRDAALYEDWLRGAALAELEAKYGLSRDRVQVILGEITKARRKANEGS